MAAEEPSAFAYLCSRSRLLLLTVACSLAARFLYLRYSGPQPRVVPERFRHCDVGGGPILVGTHHKTGTVLLQHLLKDSCKILGWVCSFNDVPRKCNGPEMAKAAGLDLCMQQHGVRFKLATGAPNRFVHAIRDPLEVVLSGYSYHLKTTERWALRSDKRYNGSSYREHLNSLSLEDGLRAEVKHAMRDALKTMPRLANRTGGKPCTLTVRLEDFERDWDGTTAALWDLMGVRDPVAVAKLDRAAAVHNVYTKKPIRYNKHVTLKSAASGPNSRDRMRGVMRGMGEQYEAIRRVRLRLGYPAVGKEAATT